MARLVITGCTNGIGKSMAETLAATEHHLIMAVRDTKRGHELRHALTVKNPNAQIDVVECNLASRGSIDTCADLIISRFSTIDVLVNNAGAMFHKPRLAESGYELTFATNHLGPFQLTNRLMPALLAPKSEEGTQTGTGAATKTAPSRVVVVASTTHLQATMDFDNLTNTYDYSMLRAYSRSKLANVMFANALARRYEQANIRVNSLHPGSISTNILPSNSLLWRSLGKAAALFGIMQPAHKGAATPLYLALDERAADMQGLYLDEHQIPQACAPIANTVSAQERLWDLSATATGTG